MTDEQLERGIEMITAMLAAREAGAGAKVIEASPEPEPLENSETSETPAKRTAQRKRGKDMGTAPEDAVPE